MGYPMTYHRVVNRNHLEGDYSTQAPEWFAWETKTTRDNDTIRELIDHWNGAAAGFNNKVRILMGDLRRFERDTVDEQATCKALAVKTGVDAETVAVVLKAFLEW